MTKKLLLIIFFLLLSLIPQKAFAYCRPFIDYSINHSMKTVIFQDTMSTKITHYYWDFGDGKSSTAKKPTHTYSASGAYKIRLFVRDSIGGCMDSTTRNLTINGCNSSVNIWNTQNILYFLTQASGIYKLKYDFGDGTYSAKDSGKHVYTNFGTYNVCLTVHCTPTDSSKSCKSITLTNSSCHAQFYPNDSFNRLDIKFMNQSSSSSNMQFYWNFGDGKSSNLRNPTHVYSNQGSYTVCLTIKDTTTKCLDSACRSFTLTANCDSGFNYTSRLDTLYYYYNGNAPNVKWNFGNGKTSTSKNGTHIYGKLGVFNVCLKTYCPSDSSEKCLTITLGKLPCKAKFTKSLDTTQKFKLFLINNSTYTSTTTYKWSFGDGGTSTLRNPTHKYNSFGKYFVCLTITDSTCSSYYCDTIGMDSTGKLLKADGFGMEVIEGTTKINKITHRDFNIYPNPANTKVFIAWDNGNANYTNLEIINVQGQICFSQQIDVGSKNLEINLEGIAKGLYLIKLSNNNGYSLARVIKE